jgi:hypothetical protein
VSSLLLDPVKGPLVVSSVKRAYLREMPNDPLADPDAKVILSSLRDLVRRLSFLLAIVSVSRGLTALLRNDGYRRS